MTVLLIWLSACIICSSSTIIDVVSGFSSSSISSRRRRSTTATSTSTTLSYTIVFPEEETPPSEPIDPLAIDLAEDATREITKMMVWAENYGMQRGEGCTLSPMTSDYNKDVHIMATQDLPSGSPIVYVPEELIVRQWKNSVTLKIWRKNSN